MQGVGKLKILACLGHSQGAAIAKTGEGLIGWKDSILPGLGDGMMMVDLRFSIVFREGSSTAWVGVPLSGLVFVSSLLCRCEWVLRMLSQQLRSPDLDTATIY